MPLDQRDEDLLAELGRRMKAAREAAGLSGVDAAANLSVDRRTLQTWESGSRAAPAIAIPKMAALYGVTSEWLLSPDEPFRALVDPEIERRAVTAEDIDQHTEYSQLVSVLVTKRLQPMSSQREFQQRMERIAARGDQLRGEAHGKT